MEKTEVVKVKNSEHRPSRSPFKYANIVRKLEQAFSIGCDITEACDYAEISRDTYYRWVKNNRTLSDRFESLQRKPILKSRQTIINNLDDVNTARWYLERKKKDEFSPKIEMEHSVDDEDKKALRDAVELLKNKTDGDNTGEKTNS